MKQLKFNPDKDMKELEKYNGIKKKIDDEIVYCFYYEGDIEFYIDEDGEICFDKWPECIYFDFVFRKLYDLIKANLLIVESDEDEKS